MSLWPVVIKKLQRKLGITTIYVTHDQEEALAISDRIAVMKDGVIMQCGTPTEIYAKPQNPFVAGFIGVSNFLDCTMEKGGLVDIKGELKVNVPVKSSYTGPAKLSARPEQLFFSDAGMPGTVQFSTFDDGQSLVVNEYTKDTTEVYAAGEKVFLRFDPQRINVYAAESEEVITC